MTSAESSLKPLAPIERSDWLLIAAMLPIYFLVWQRFGPKFLAGTAIAFLTGLCFWLLLVVFQPGHEMRDATQIPFAWHLFAFFPVFCPLALPLWLIPIILIISYLVTISSFGGFGRHFFNPIAFAVIFMICGYADTASLGPSRPFPTISAGYSLWSAGMPPAKPLWHIYSAIKPGELWQSSVSGNLPAIPGSAFPGMLLLLAFSFAMLTGRRRVWFIAVVCSIACWVWLGQHYLGWNFSAWHPLLFGSLPALLLVGVADYKTLPASFFDQLVAAAIFSALLLLFLLKANDALAPAFALLFAQVVAPLVSDLCKIGSRP